MFRSSQRPAGRQLWRRLRAFQGPPGARLLQPDHPGVLPRPEQVRDHHQVLLQLDADGGEPHFRHGHAGCRHPVGLHHASAW